MKASLSVISLINYAFSVVSKKSCPNLRSFRFSPILCSRSFMVLRFTFRSVILFQLIFVTGIRLLSRFFFFCIECSVVSTPFVENNIFAPFHCLCSFVQRSVDYMGLHLGSLVYSIDLFICSLSNTTPPWLL